jgi:very-short-patch-repair endonuclease
MLHPNILTGIEHMSDENAFASWFPIGLPVGIAKPNLSISTIRGVQYLEWKETDEVTVLSGDIYPDFCMFDLAAWIKEKHKRLIKFSTPDVVFGEFKANEWTITYNVCQTPVEKLFMESYMEKFVISYKRYNKQKKSWYLAYPDLKDKSPALIPQVWVQWNNQALKTLNRTEYDNGSLYRVDFAVFWNSKMYIILLDGIQHYAKQQGNRWDADEEKYATRLKEDRWLSLQGWEVFRIGNWELRDESRRNQVLEELREFIGFQEPPIPIEEPDDDDDDLPF